MRRIINWFINLFKSKKVYELPEHNDKAQEIAPWMPIARKELGEKEIPGSEHNPKIVEYGGHVKLDVNDDETAWCSMFVNYVLYKSGYQGTYSAAARSFINWGRKIEGPVYGCVVVFQRGNSSWQGHVGFFVGHEGDNLLILGGNQSNSVNISKYPKSKVLAYRMPK